MINLLPPPIKEQVRYAKLNARIVRYIWVLGFSALLVGVSFFGAHWHLSQRMVKADEQMKQKQADIAKFKPFEEKVKQVNDRLSAIKAIQATQPRFSALLVDLSAVTPKGVTISSVTLTGVDAQPVRISAAANSMNSATAFRENLAASPRIAAADIETISKEPGGVRVSIVVAFKPGLAK